MSHISSFNIVKAVTFVLGIAVLCLGLYPAEAAFQEPLQNSCITCHKDLPDDRLSRPVTLWASSVHAEVGNTCDGCHGGDPKDPTEASMSDSHRFYLGPKKDEVTAFCGKCHQELSEYFKQSAHSATGTQNCIQCHGTHTVQRISLEIIDPEKCGTCHEYELADKLKVVLSGLHDQFGMFKEKIKNIKGLPTQPLEAQLGKVWSQLRQARMISHTFDLTRIKKKAEGVQGLMATMEAEISRLEEIEQERQFFGWGLIALFVALSIATYFYNRTERETE